MAIKIGHSAAAEALDAKDFDISTFVLVVLLTVSGFISIYSATYAAQMSDRFSLQLLFGAGGIVILLVMALLPIRWLSVAAYPFYAFSLGLLVLVLVAGKVVYSQKNWLAFGGLSFQPSELAKLATIMAIGKYLSGDRKLTRPSDLIVASIIVIIPIALILAEPDPGSAMIYVGLLFIILLWAGADLFLLLAIIGPGVAAVMSLFGKWAMLGSVLAIGAMMFLGFRKNLITTTIVFLLVIGASFSSNILYTHLHPYQQERIDLLLNPEADPQGGGYNIIQSKMAIGSGGMFGKGYLKGSQTQLRFVPKQWTDFIMSVPAEEFGFVGAMVLLILYIILISRSLAIASSVRSNFSSVIAIGIAGIWLLHVTVNIGMTLGVVPVVGIPLPFMSYGGSSLVTNMLMAGILMNLYRNRRIQF
ncbi:MAG TPA: rod shape-determining protein RodA [Candidatus Kapabacteria bacterium]|nr:rod shape-determining protein RodA [Candidatus Kapabacteria bacterium]